MDKNTEQQFKNKLVELQEIMHRYALSLTSDPNDAEDLMQETTLRALRNMEKFVENVNFRGWVLTIMRNIFLNNYERKSRQREMIDSSVDVHNVPILAEGGYMTPDGAMKLGEINDAIDNLSENTRIPFRMHVSGYKYSEIAQALGVPVGTVKSRIYFARQELQRNLRDLHY